jgi:hypothetical protein
MPRKVLGLVEGDTADGGVIFDSDPPHVQMSGQGPTPVAPVFGRLESPRDEVLRMDEAELWRPSARWPPKLESHES